MQLEAADQSYLLDLARTAIVGSLDAGRALPAPTHEWPALLSEHRASFVTLTIRGVLRGCIGSIEASQALADDVWSNAQRTAFEDPRFPALRENEARDTLLEISVMSPLEHLHVSSEQALLKVLRPGVDGLLLSCGSRRATFLPKVWQKLPDPHVFLKQLRRKMGVAEDFWDDALVIKRYATQEFGEMLHTGAPVRRTAGQ